MGVSENSVPLNPMVNDHYPILSLLNGYLFGNIPYFQTNPNGNLVKVSVVTFSVKVSPSKTSSINFVQLNMVGPRNLKQKHKRLGCLPHCWTQIFIICIVLLPYGWRDLRLYPVSWNPNHRHIHIPRPPVEFPILILVGSTSNSIGSIGSHHICFPSN